MRSSCACWGSGAVCVGGPDGVRLFYDPERFRRRDAMPRPLAATLFGKGAVHLHDGAAHRHRKAMLLSLLDQAAAKEIATSPTGSGRPPCTGGGPPAGWSSSTRPFGSSGSPSASGPACP